MEDDAPPDEVMADEFDYSMAIRWLLHIHDAGLADIRQFINDIPDNGDLRAQAWRLRVEYNEEYVTWRVKLRLGITKR